MRDHAGRSDLELLVQSVSQPPRLCPLQPIGGVVKARIDDFEVEEVPAYEPCGEGEHLYLWIEKRGLGAEELVKTTAKKLQVPEAAIGIAGLKDRQAIARQYVSVPRAAEDRLSQLDSKQLSVLRVCPHRHKLRTGHLLGNKFKILVREVPDNAFEQAAALTKWLRVHGLANFYGPQRFGRDLSSAKDGIAALRSGRGALLRLAGTSRFKRKLLLSAGQAVLFNDYLSARVQRALLHKVVDGDVLKKLSGGLLISSEPAADQQRYEQHEVVPTGPVFGRKMMSAQGAARVLEAEVLQRFGIGAEQFDQFGLLLAGTRRPILVWVDDLVCLPVESGLELRFSLPAGSYATVLLAEFGFGGLVSLARGGQ